MMGPVNGENLQTDHDVANWADLSDKCLADDLLSEW
jgi:hypothetical protein